MRCAASLVIEQTNKPKASKRFQLDRFGVAWSCRFHIFVLLIASDGVVVFVCAVYMITYACTRLLCCNDLHGTTRRTNKRTSKRGPPVGHPSSITTTAARRSPAHPHCPCCCSCRCCSCCCCSCCCCCSSITRFCPCIVGRFACRATMVVDRGRLVSAAPAFLPPAFDFDLMEGVSCCRSG